MDDSHVIISFNGKDSLIDCKTGKSSVVVATPVGTEKVDKPSVSIKKNDVYIKINDVETQLTNDSAKEINAVLSPDDSYVAFTKNNDLYTINISTKKKQGSLQMEAMLF